jgi:tetratricopeptide (TPR) repeat protein
MARLELAGFPDNEWKVDPTRPQLVSAQAHLERALAEDASNVTALYRLGALALERDDLNAARMYLEAAYRFDANHRGVRKMLGYVDVWSGDFERAAQLLATIPEAPGEIEVYVWWWKTQGRDDLSALAEQMLAYLAQTGR